MYVVFSGSELGFYIYIVVGDVVRNEIVILLRFIILIVNLEVYVKHTHKHIVYQFGKRFGFQKATWKC